MRLSLLFAILLVAAEAHACSVCVSKPLKFAFQDSSLFFVGTVTERREWDVTFKVEEQFVGAPAEEVTLQTSNSCSMSQFSHGQTYLVEATETGQGLHAYLCSHTQQLIGNSRKFQLVKRRATWWKSRLSRVSLYRLRYFIGRHLGG